MKRPAFWFRHDYSARNDEKILALRALHGNEAYAIFWMLIEYMAESPTGWISMTSMPGLAMGLGVDAEKLNAVVLECIKLELFVEKDGRFTSMRLQSHKNEREENRKTGRLGGMAKASHSGRHPKGSLKGPSTNETRRDRDTVKGKGTRDAVTPRSTSARHAPREDRDEHATDDATPPASESTATTKPVAEHLRPLAMFAMLRDMKFSTSAEVTACIKRNARVSKDLAVVPLDKLAVAMVLAEEHWSQKRDYPLRLETVSKFVDDVGTAPMRLDLKDRATQLLMLFERDLPTVFVPTPTPAHV